MMKHQTKVSDIEADYNNKKFTYTQKKTSSIFKVNLQDKIIGSNLILTGLLKILIQESRSFTRVNFEKMYLFKMINDRQYFLIKFGR